MSGEPTQDIDSGTGKVITPGEPAAHTDIVDGQSVGHHAEPEHTEGATGNEPPPPPADPPPPTPPPKTSLEDIYAKAQTGRSAEMDEDVANMTEAGKAEHMQRLVAEAGGGDDPFAQPPSDPNATPPAQPPAAPPPVDPAAAPQIQQPVAPAADPAQQNPPQGIDAAPETTTITIYGMREDVPTADVTAAGGIDAYQKNRAADIRMERAATYEASLRAYDQRLTERAAAEEQGAQVPAQTGTGATESSPTDAQGDTIDVNALSEQLTEAVYSGDRESAQKEFASVLASVKSDAIKAAQAMAAQSVPSGPTPAEQLAEQRAREDANAVFLNEFKDLNNPTLRAAVLSTVGEVSNDPIMRGRPLAEITREACTRVRADVYGSNPPPAPSDAPAPPSNPLITAPTAQPASTDLSNRLEMKRRTVITPVNEAHGRVVPAPSEQTHIPTNAEVVANMRKSRGQPA